MNAFFWNAFLLFKNNFFLNAFLVERNVAFLRKKRVLSSKKKGSKRTLKASSQCVVFFKNAFIAVLFHHFFSMD